MIPRLTTNQRSRPLILLILAITINVVIGQTPTQAPAPNLPCQVDADCAPLNIPNAVCVNNICSIIVDPTPTPTPKATGSCSITSLGNCGNTWPERLKNPLILGIIVGGFLLGLCCFAVKTTKAVAGAGLSLTNSAAKGVARAAAGGDRDRGADRPAKQNFEQRRLRPPSPTSTEFHRERIYGDERAFITGAAVGAAGGAAADAAYNNRGRDRRDMERGGSGRDYDRDYDRDQNPRGAQRDYSDRRQQQQQRGRSEDDYYDKASSATGGPAPLPKNYRKPVKFPLNDDPAVMAQQAASDASRSARDRNGPGGNYGNNGRPFMAQQMPPNMAGVVPPGPPPPGPYGGPPVPGPYGAPVPPAPAGYPAYGPGVYDGYNAAPGYGGFNPHPYYGPAMPLQPPPPVVPAPMVGPPPPAGMYPYSSYPDPYAQPYDGQDNGNNMNMNGSGNGDQWNDGGEMNAVGPGSAGAAVAGGFGIAATTSGRNNASPHPSSSRYVDPANSTPHQWTSDSPIPGSTAANQATLHAAGAGQQRSINNTVNRYENESQVGVGRLDDFEFDDSRMGTGPMGTAAPPSEYGESEFEYDENGNRRVRKATEEGAGNIELWAERQRLIVEKEKAKARMREERERARLRNGGGSNSASGSAGGGDGDGFVDGEYDGVGVEGETMQRAGSDTAVGAPTANRGFERRGGDRDMEETGGRDGRGRRGNAGEVAAAAVGNNEAARSPRDRSRPPRDQSRARNKSRVREQSLGRNNVETRSPRSADAGSASGRGDIRYAGRDEDFVEQQQQGYSNNNYRRDDAGSESRSNNGRSDRGGAGTGDIIADYAADPTLQRMPTAPGGRANAGAPRRVPTTSTSTSREDSSRDAYPRGGVAEGEYYTDPTLQAPTYRGDRGESRRNQQESRPAMAVNSGAAASSRPAYRQQPQTDGYADDNNDTPVSPRQHRPRDASRQASTRRANPNPNANSNNSTVAGSPRGYERNVGGGAAPPARRERDYEVEQQMDDGYGYRAETGAGNGSPRTAIRERDASRARDRSQAPRGRGNDGY
ncbi:hypothetical protein HDU76_010809 [Blyttiomyces sp. JEL0837]|nr:hypothetical protein HDU76_010809 [Blyttiomyces sp. JEL0837]